MDVELDGLFRHNTTYDYIDYEYKEDFESGGPTAVFIPFLYSMALVVGLFGNGLLLAVLALKRRSWSLSDTFILHLSVADVLLLVTLPFWAAEAAQHYGWCFGGFLCKFSGVVFNLNFYCSIFLLVCISMDCYLSITHTTMLYSEKKPRLVHISCLLVWIGALILTIPGVIFLVTRKDPVKEKTWCDQDYSQSVSYRLLVSRLPHHMLGFLLPAAALIVSCFCILLQLQRSLKGLQKQKAAIRLILLLAGVLFLCWMPYNITLIVDTIRKNSNGPDDMQSGNTKGSLQTALDVTKALGCVNACLRPLLYFGWCANFRKQVMNMLRCTTVEHNGSLWELCVGEQALPDQSPEEEAEQKQMMSVDHQTQSAQC